MSTNHCSIIPNELTRCVRRVTQILAVKLMPVKNSRINVVLENPLPYHRTVPNSYDLNRGLQAFAKRDKFPILKGSLGGILLHCHFSSIVIINYMWSMI